MTPDEFREIALNLPETEERSHMNHPDFRVGGKIFASLGPDLSWGMAKLTPEQQRYFIESEPSGVAPASGKWGDGGATIFTLANADADTIRNSITAAWRNTAPARLTRDPFD